MREPWEDGEEDFEEAKQKMLEELENKYFLIAINNTIKFINVMTREKIPVEKASVDGFDYDELEKLHDKFVQGGVSAIFMQYGLMKQFSQGEGLHRLYKFNPVKGDKKQGVLIPEQFNINEGRPDRKEVIKEEEAEGLSNMLDKLNSGELSFEDFLKLT